MKIRIFLFFVAFFSLFSLSVLADNYIDGTKQTLQEKFDFTKLDNNLVNNVIYRFCDQGMDKLSNEAILTLKKGQFKKICGLFYNGYSGGLQVDAQVVDGTKNEFGAVVCQAGLSSFSGYVSLHSLGSISLSGISSVLMPVYLHIPPTFNSGEYTLCVTYSVLDSDTMKPGQMFAYKIQKAVPITIVVSDDIYYRQRLDDGISFLKNNIKIIAWIIILLISFLLLKEIIPFFKTSSKKHKK